MRAWYQQKAKWQLWKTHFIKKLLIVQHTGLFSLVWWWKRSSKRGPIKADTLVFGVFF
jgi:hypothetical protein